MYKYLFLIIFSPLVSFSQINISIDLVERSEVDKQFNQVFDISIGKYFSNNFIVGITNKKSKADFIQYGSNPVQDSLVIANYQIFSKLFLKDNFFFSLKSPLKSKYNFARKDRTRVGFGIKFKSNDFEKLNFFLSYDYLIKKNSNGWRKGEIKFGISTNLDNLN